MPIVRSFGSVLPSCWQRVDVHRRLLRRHPTVALMIESVQPGALASAPKRVVLKIVPENVVSWDHRKFGGRY